MQRHDSSAGGADKPLSAGSVMPLPPAHTRTPPPVPCLQLAYNPQLKDYVEQVLQLQADKDQLLMQLELLKHQQEQQQQQPRTDASSSSSNSIAVEQQLFELRLQKEQAVAAAARLKQQLAELFPAATAGAAGGDSSLLDPGQAGRPGSAAGVCVVCIYIYVCEDGAHTCKR